MSHWIRPAARWAVYRRDQLQCVWCERHLATTLILGGWFTLDHAMLAHASTAPTARRQQGRFAQATESLHVAENLLTACWMCNTRRGRTSWEAFALEQNAVTRVCQSLRAPSTTDRAYGRTVTQPPAPFVRWNSLNARLKRALDGPAANEFVELFLDPGSGHSPVDDQLPYLADPLLGF